MPEGKGRVGSTHDLSMTHEGRRGREEKEKEKEKFHCRLMIIISLLLLRNGAGCNLQPTPAEPTVGSIRHDNWRKRMEQRAASRTVRVDESSNEGSLGPGTHSLLVAPPPQLPSPILLTSFGRSHRTRFLRVRIRNIPLPNLTTFSPTPTTLRQWKSRHQHNHVILSPPSYRHQGPHSFSNSQDIPSPGVQQEYATIQCLSRQSGSLIDALISLLSERAKWESPTCTASFAPCVCNLVIVLVTLTSSLPSSFANGSSLLSHIWRPGMGQQISPPPLSQI